MFFYIQNTYFNIISGKIYLLFKHNNIHGHISFRE
jgi:hypothetical protein